MRELDQFNTKADPCPQCGSEETRTETALRQRPSVLFLLLLGWYYLLICGAFRRVEARCLDCQHEFRYKTVGSRIAMALLIVLILAILTTLYLEN